MNHFFITGMPRSRTAWLANLLTYGPSFCYHDLTRETRDSVEFGVRLQSAEALVSGDSDSGLLLDVEKWVQVFPRARWVLIHRNAEECEKSFRRYFHPERPYPGVTEGVIGPAFQVCVERFEAAKVALKDRVLNVNFNDLWQEDVVEGVWQWCLPGTRFPRARWGMLETFQVNVMPEKLSEI